MTGICLFSILEKVNTGIVQVAMFVGGCVRDSLLGYPVTDIDMSTTALPDSIMQIAKANNLRAIARNNYSYYKLQ